VQAFDVLVADWTHVEVVDDFKNVKLRNFLIIISVKEIKCHCKHISSISQDHLNLSFEVFKVDSICKIQKVLHFLCCRSSEQVSHKLFRPDFSQSELSQAFEIVFAAEKPGVISCY